jgi:hypothetical protein
MRTTVAAMELVLLLSGRALLATLGSAATKPMRAPNHSGHGHHSFLAALGQVAVRADLLLLQRLRAWPTS